MISEKRRKLNIIEKQWDFMILLENVCVCVPSEYKHWKIGILQEFVNNEGCKEILHSERPGI